MPQSSFNPPWFVQFYGILATVVDVIIGIPLG
jgi:hypothetical protein